MNFSVNRVRRVDFPYSNNVILLLFICVSLAEMIDGQENSFVPVGLKEEVSLFNALKA